MPHIGEIVQIGLRGMGSSRKEDFDDARAYGALLITAKEVRRIGPEGVVAKIPKADRYFVSIDIDGYDISIAPGVGSPSPGGLYYDEVLDMLAGLCTKGEIVGFDLVEVAPQYDPANVTCRVAALTILNFMGQIMKNRGKE